ncbi:MAG: aminoacetone oxidase family FAD-binding enzyme, partial [Bacteroidota bacterium]
MKTKQIVVVGGGAAGFFAAINCAEQAPDTKVVILERAKETLGKVRISGGGRCNVCHEEYDPRELAKSYPRGEKALLGPFHRFCTGDTVGWYYERGVELKTEADGRMFPTTDDSGTIVNCLQGSAMAAGVEVRTQMNMTGLEKGEDGKWLIECGKAGVLEADRVLLASGSNQRIWKMLGEMGHKIVSPVPSLFTFNVKDPRIKDLMGISVPAAEVRVAGSKLLASGPLLITHWGFSGPAVLRISAWGARELHGLGYDFELRLNWAPAYHLDDMVELLRAQRQAQARQQIALHPQANLPKRLWRRLCTAAGIPDNLRWADLSKTQLRTLATEITDGRYPVRGKSTFKEEFVTAGGVALNEVNFKTMESKRLPGLHFAGEVLDID